MKLLSFLLFCVISLTVCSQDTNSTTSLTNALVNFKPDNQPYVGITNYPASMLTVSFQTNLPGWSTNMLLEDYFSYVSAIQSSPAWILGKSNANFIRNYTFSNNYALWYSIFTNIPTGIADCTTRTNSAWNDYMSFISGTNNAAGTNRIIANLLIDRYVGYIYHRQILDYLTRLGPGLQKMYDPLTDPRQ